MEPHISNRLLTEKDVEVLVQAIDERIEWKMDEHHLCRFNDRQFQVLTNFCEFWDKDGTTIKNITSISNTSAKFLVISLGGGILLAFSWLLYMMFSHGFSPGGKQ